MINPLHIAQGAANSLFNLNKNMSEKRMEICKACPIYSKKFGGLCNNKLWMNPNTKDISFNKKDGYINGCGCKLTWKTAVADENCPVGKW